MAESFRVVGGDERADITTFISEVKILKETISRLDARPSNGMELLELLKAHRVIFDKLWQMAVISMVAPVSTAGGERSFSALRRVKSFLRTSTGDERLGDLIVLHSSPDITAAIDHDHIVDQFRELAQRRISL